MLIRCLIIDDEPLAVNLLKQYVDAIPYLQLTGTCYSAVEALQFLHEHPVDLVFLDINMPKLTGMELAANLLHNPKIIFTTAYSQHALESYEYNAIDYLLKPITFNRFVQAVQKVATIFKEVKEEHFWALPEIHTDAIYIKSGKAVIQVAYRDVLFIEGLKDYVIFYTITAKHIIYKRMKELEEVLPDIFIRVHNSFIINQQHIQKIEDQHISIHSNRIPISEKYKDLFFEVINKRLL